MIRHIRAINYVYSLKMFLNATLKIAIKYFWGLQFIQNEAKGFAEFSSSQVRLINAYINNFIKKVNVFLLG